MKPVEIKPGIYWVGAVDWNLRNFHGYITQRGSTYNAYLIVDEKTVLVDTVKHYLFEEMLSRIEKVIDPSGIDYVVSNHVEMDHSGSIPRILKIAPEAKVVTSPQGERGLQRHFKRDWDFQVVRSGDIISVGKHSLQFFLTSMVHWPDNMVTFVPEERLLLSNDAFGQHLASAQRFDDEVGWDIVSEEAAKYYANIVLPYGEQVKKALASLSGLDIGMIAPSHGVIWRTYLPKILESYQKWANNETEARALIVHDTMWGSTSRIAESLQEGLESEGIPVTMRSLKANHISDILTDVLFSKVILIGSPTLNQGVLPTIGAFLTYLKGLRPKNRLGFVFGSYGWGGQAIKEIESVMRNLSWEMPLPSINIQYVPDEEELDRPNSPNWFVRNEENHLTYSNGTINNYIVSGTVTADGGDRIVENEYAIDSAVYSVLLMQNILVAITHRYPTHWALQLTIDQLVDNLPEGEGNDDHYTGLNCLLAVDGEIMYAASKYYTGEDEYDIVYATNLGGRPAWLAATAQDGVLETMTLWGTQNVLTNNYYIELEPREGFNGPYTLTYPGVPNDNRYYELFNAGAMDETVDEQTNPEISPAPDGQVALVFECEDAIYGNALNVMGLCEDFSFAIAEDANDKYTDPDVIFDPRMEDDWTNDYYVTYCEIPSGGSEVRDVIVKKYAYDPYDDDWTSSGTPYTISDGTDTDKEVKNPAIAMDDEGNILVVWQQKETGSYDWEIHGKCVESDLSTVVYAEFSLDVSGTEQQYPDIAWIGTTGSTPKFVVAYEQSNGSPEQNGLFMHRIQPEGTPELSSPAAVILNTASIYGDEPSLAVTGDYFICGYRNTDNLRVPSTPYSVLTKQYDSPLDSALSGIWAEVNYIAQSDDYAEMDSHVDLSGGMDDNYDVAYIVDVDSKTYVYAGECKVNETIFTEENWSVDDDNTFAHPTVAISYDRRLIAWETDNDADGNGIWGRFDPSQFPDGAVQKRALGDNSKDEIPEGFALHKTYPNPFNPVTNISFDLGKDSYVKLSIYNINGRLVADLINRKMTSGSHKVIFDASDLSSGM